MAAADETKDDSYVTLTSDSLKSTVKIHKFGAHVVSWTLDGKEQLYLSKLAKLDGSKAIRGGIPLVFPQFGPGKLKQHGFARDRFWQLITVDNQCDCPFAVFRLTVECFVLTVIYRILGVSKRAVPLAGFGRNPSGVAESLSITAHGHSAVVKHPYTDDY